jgi:hypothetical protein
MKKLFPFLLAALLLVAIAVVNAEDAATPVEKPWFDMPNCGFCKHLLTDGLIDHLDWQNHVVATGMMSVTTVEPGWEDKYKVCMAAMEETGKKMMAGEQVPMCGFCTSYGALYATGKITFEEFETKTGDVTLVTSTDPEIIAMIQQHAQRTIDEFAKMEAAKHEGHNH